MAEQLKKILEDEEKLNEIVKVAFDNVNTDKSGKISKEQLGSMMSQISKDLGHEGPQQKEIDEVFDYLDSKKTNSLDTDDFKVLIKDVLKNMIKKLSY